MFYRMLCFIAFKSLIGQKRGTTMIRKPVMWKMKDLAYKTERWRREIIKYMTNVEPGCISCSNPLTLQHNTTTKIYLRRRFRSNCNLLFPVSPHMQVYWKKCDEGKSAHVVEQQVLSCLQEYLPAGKRTPPYIQSSLKRYLVKHS